MAIAEHYPPDALTPETSYDPAIEILDYISELQIPELQTLPNPDEAFYNYQLGRVFAEVVDLHGEPGAGGYQQLRGSDGNEHFLATFFPGYHYGANNEKYKPAGFHAIINPVGEASYTIPVTINSDTGIPIVGRNIKVGQHGETDLSGPLDPRESMAEVRHLAALMATTLKNYRQALTATFEDPYNA